MAGINITNLEAARAACSTLEDATAKHKVVYDTAAVGGPFNTLANANPDLGTNFINELKQSVSDIYNFLSNHILPAAQAMVASDVSTGGGTGGTGGGGYSGGGGGGGVTPGGVDPTPETPIVPMDDSDVTDDTPLDEESIIPAGSEIAEVVTEELEEMPLTKEDSLIGSIVDLSKQNDETLDEFLTDPNNAETIKDLLLKSPYLSDDLKAELKDMDPYAVQAAILQLLMGEQPAAFNINTLNLDVIYTYLEKVAEDNSITIEQLLNDEEYADLLKNTLLSFGAVIDLYEQWEDMPSKDVQKMLLKLYSGDEVDNIPTTAVEITRNLVDSVCDATEIYYEDLLMDQDYADTLKKGAQELGKSLLFAKTTTNFKEKTMTKVMQSLFNGENPGALGMDKSELDSFKSELDELAKKNNVSTETLLTNSQYADSVKECLANSEYCDGIGAIFENSPSEISQNVASNLYKKATDIEAFESDKANEGKEYPINRSAIITENLDILVDNLKELNKKVSVEATASVTTSEATMTA